MLDDIKKTLWATAEKLRANRDIGAEEVEDDDEAFVAKMQKLTEKLGEQMDKGAEYDALIRQKQGGLGYGF